MDYPSNSKQTQKPEEKPEPKKIEKVVEGGVVRRKQPVSKKFTELFVGGDAKSTWAYVAYDVLLPRLKDMAADAVSQGVERLIFGEVRSGGRARSSSPNGYVSYNRYSPTSTRRMETREPLSRKARTMHNFDEIILDNRAAAEEVIDRLFDLVSRYEVATVADLYELVGEEVNYTDSKWGWTDIRGAGVTRVRSGYLLDIPRPEPIN